jgi:flagellin
MRIQHNIMAMNAYRNYNNNTSALSSNLEKLSSGYKINRAGDDAAGLAISEKMRAQISGLDQAASNVKDGISLVKTGEGALQEVQDMLNRMVTLATQSANGTYDSSVDRDNLQKEVISLKDEINRIADSANFNGINLLDGSMDGAAVAATSTLGDFQNLTIGTVATGTAGTSHTAGSSYLHTDGTTASEPSFTVDLSNVSFTAGDANGIVVNIGSAAITVAKTAAGTAFATGTKYTAATLVAAIVATANSIASGVSKVKTTGGGQSGELKGVKIGNNVYKATASGNSVKFDLVKSDGTNNLADDSTQLKIASGTIVDPVGTVTLTSKTASTGTFEGLDAAGHAATKVTIGQGADPTSMACASISLANSDIKDGTEITIGNTTYMFQVGKDSTATASNGETVIDMKDVKLTDANLAEKAIAKLTQQSNSWFRLESGTAGKLQAVELAAYSGTDDLKTTTGLQANFKIAQMNTTAAVAADPTKSLTLQIGDTSDSFNKLSLNIKNMHVSNLGIDDVDISTQAGAQAAIDKIKSAINTVSSVRGDLGAVQNRLEHTQNNLSVMSENIQDAESTIRDTDVAEEMMSYTKNNILVQSAQAMLAQANSVPQGVLQLLQ